MGEYSQLVFGRRRIPRRAIVCAGVYFPDRKEAFRSVFDSWSPIRGRWIRHSFARKSGKEFVIVFGIYGAAMMLETVQLLREGGAKEIFMVGSMYAKSLPVGALVVPTEIEDIAGIVLVDDASAGPARPDEYLTQSVRRELAVRRVPHSEGRISSVPAVLHGIAHVDDRVNGRQDVLGQEMEGSTFLYFTRKHGIKAGALFYVSDNKEHSIISGRKGVVEARRSALRIAARVAVAALLREC